MVGSRHKDAEGDLLPRGAAPGSTPRVRKRNGQILFGPQLKRPKKKESKDETLVEDTVTRHGSGLSFSRLSAGMTVLALVTKADVNGVEFTIPGGIRAAADPDEVLIQNQSTPMRKGFKSDHDGSDSDSSDTDVDDAEDQPLLLYEALTVGSVVRAVLIDIDANYHGRKAARVSMRPELVNVGLNPKHILRKGFPAYGVIRSIEDHGYVVSFGTNIAHRGFLSFQRCHVSREEQTLQPGVPIETVTLKEIPLPGKRSKNFSAVVKLSSIRKEVLNASLDSSEAVTYRDLCAGMLVKAKIVQVGEGGLVLTAFGVFDVEVDATHVPRNEAGEMDFEPGRQVLTRLIYVDPALKRIGGTLLESIVKNFVPRQIPPGLKTGTIIKSLIVDRVKPGFGVLMRQDPEETDADHEVNVNEEHEIVRDSEVDEKYSIGTACTRSLPIFAHLSRISDSKGLKLESRYQKGMRVDTAARVISISRLDGVVNVDMRRSVLSRKALSIDEIDCGSVYDCRVLSHTSLGSIAVAVDGDPYLNGIIPHLHVSDVPIPSTRLSKHPHLRIGALLKCRVLYVKVDRGKIYLTARKSLVSPTYPMLTSYEQARDSLTSAHDDKRRTGVLGSTNVFSGTSRMVTSKGGLLVEFCNGVVGLVRSDSLSLDKGGRKTPSKIEEVYPIGETVHVRIVSADPGNRRLFLSMNLQADPNSRDGELLVGERVHGTVIGIDEQIKSVLLSVAANASKKVRQAKHRKSNTITCHLPFGHLSDVHGLSERLASEIRRHLSSEHGSSEPLCVRNLLVLSVGIGPPVVSMKPSLRKATETGTLPMSFDDLTKTFSETKKSGTRALLRGYVKALLPGGVIVGFLGDVVGFVRKSRIADQFVSDPARFLKIHQSCSVVVDDVDIVKKRFTLSMRPSDVGNSCPEEDCIELFSCIEEWRTVLVGKPLDRSFSIGTLIEAAPSSSRPFGTLYNLKVGESTAVGVAFNANETSPDVILCDGSETVNDIDMEDLETNDDHDKRKQTLRILDVDPFSDVVDLSADKDIVSGFDKEAVLPSVNELRARVVLVKHIYIILSVEVSKKKSVIAFAIFPPLHDALQLRPGSLLKCKTIKAGGKVNDRNLVAINWAQAQGRARAGKEQHPLSNLGDVASISILKSTAAQDESGVIGMQVSGKVTKSFSSHVFIGIGPGVVGHLHVKNTGMLSEEELSSIELGPLSKLYSSRYGLPKVGTIVRPAYVRGVRRHEDKQNKLPMILDLSLHRTSPVTKLQVGEKILGFVQHVSTRLMKSGGIAKGNKHKTVITAGSDSWISVSDVNCLFKDKAVNIEPGMPVICMITKTEQESKHLEGTMSENGADGDKEFLGIVKDVIPGHGVKVLTPWKARREEEKSTSWGMVDICDVSSNFEETVSKMENLKDGDVVRVQRVPDLKEDTEEKKRTVYLTMRTSKLDSNARDPLISRSPLVEMKAGKHLRGFVRAVDKKGCFVSIGRGISAHVKLCDLSDEFVTDPKAMFPVGKLVQGKLASKGESSSKFSMVLRKRPRRKLAEDVSQRELTEGAKVTGKVMKIEAYGALISIGGGGVALLHKSEVDQDRFVKNAFDEWEVGQNITAIVIKVRNGKVNVGTKRCYFEAAGLNDDEVSAVLEENEKAGGRASNEDNGIHAVRNVAGDMSKDGIANVEMADGDEEDAESDEYDSYEIGLGGKRSLEEDEVPIEFAPSGKSDLLFEQQLASSAPPLKVSHGFNFEEQSDLKMQSEQDDQESGEDGQGVKQGDVISNKGKKSTREKREKKREKEALEREIRTREEAIANNPNAPETVEDYERLLMGDPNNSVLWIRYMAFCLGLSQIDKARSVAERALESISLESEAERVNLWCAYVNLEAGFGMMNSKDPELNDSLGVKTEAAILRVFDRGCERITDVKDFHLRVSFALRESHAGLSEEILRRATRRFKASEDVWIAKGRNHFIDGDLQAARQTLERALMSLEKQNHIALISKFAQFEYKYGSPERGRTIFESLVGSFPKRLDLWNVYLDMEARRCSKAESEVRADIVEQVRPLYQRLVRLDLSSKKMKFAFKKWLNFEKNFGTKGNQADVKKQARDYVEKNMPSTD